MPERYSRAQIALHWIIVLLVFFQLLFEMNIGRAYYQRMQGQADGTGIEAVHIVVGALVLVLMLVRLALRLTRGAPPLPAEEPAPLKLVAHAVHWAFYVLLILAPVAGLVAWFGQVRAAASGHELMTTLLWLVIALHVLGALFQQFVLKTGIMSRMSPHG